MIVLIDNYDSFTYNLYQLLGEEERDLLVVRNDALTVEALAAKKPEAIVISPGPGRPKDAGICEEVITKLRGKVPMLGICLGHQAIAESYGGSVTYAAELMHGKESDIRILEHGVLFQGLPDTIRAGRYHSLAVDAGSLPKELAVTAVDDKGEVMAVEDRIGGVFGMQFHPESIMTPDGKQMLVNFLAEARRRSAKAAN
jgi:anthranilate synthase component 2